MGYSLNHDLGTEGVVKALKMAIKTSHSTKGVIHHSDRGLQYASGIYQETLSKAGMPPQ